MLRVVLSLAIVFSFALTTLADDGLSFIYLVRHAEKQSGSDPELTSEGTQRAKNYVDLLADCGIKQVFSTDYKRTQLTASPLAKQLKIEIEAYNPRELTDVAKQLLSLNKTVLVVGHSNTTHDLAKLLGGDEGDPIEEATEFDRIYQLVVQNGKVIHTNRFTGNNR